MRNKLHKYRFELLFFSLISILFGSLLFPKVFFVEHVLPLLFIANVFIGLIVFLYNKESSWMTIGLLLGAIILYLLRFFTTATDTLDYFKFLVYFVFYILITFEVVKQVWKAARVDKSVIFGLMSGYICLGLLAFFAFTSIELAQPNSFNGISSDIPFSQKADSLLYYSYVTLMTIGYGDITPATGIAQKASILFAMIGQFYLVIITAVVIEKYIRHRNNG